MQTQIHLVFLLMYQEFFSKKNALDAILFNEIFCPSILLKKAERRTINDPDEPNPDPVLSSKKYFK